MGLWDGMAVQQDLPVATGQLGGQLHIRCPISLDVMQYKKKDMASRRQYDQKATDGDLPLQIEGLPKEIYHRLSCGHILQIGWPRTQIQFSKDKDSIVGVPLEGYAIDLVEGRTKCRMSFDDGPDGCLEGFPVQLSLKPGTYMLMVGRIRRVVPVGQPELLLTESGWET